MVANKPTFLLVHGCFGTSAVWNKLAPFLEKSGYPVSKAELPSVNPKDAETTTAQGDIDVIRKTYLLPLLEKGEDVVIVAHSYGGVVSPPAAFGLSKTDRAASGAKGGVLGLIFVSGNVSPEGLSLFEVIGGQWPPWFQADQPKTGYGLPAPVIETLFNDIDSSQEQEAKDSILPHSMKCLMTPVSTPCWTEAGYSGRLGYVRTTQDQLNPPFVQDMSMDATKAKWDVIDFPSSHSPMFSKPEELSKVLVTFADRFEKV